MGGSRPFWTRIGAALLVALGCAYHAEPAFAEPEGMLGYQLGISENAMMAKDTHNMMMAQMAEWHTQDDLTAGRSKPNFYLTNTSENAIISEVVLSVGDLANRIAEITVLEAHSKLTYTANFTPTHDKVVLTFNSKFKPGRSVLFQLTLKPTDPNAFQYPNYLTSMFDVNGNSDADNSKLKVTFQDLVSSETLTLSKRIPDYQVPGYVPVNGPLVRSYFESRPVLAFDLDDEHIPVPLVVPEPGSLLLTLIGAVCVCTGCRRWKKSQ